jgi:hypothetical protein
MQAAGQPVTGNISSGLAKLGFELPTSEVADIIGGGTYSFLAAAAQEAATGPAK